METDARQPICIYPKCRANLPEQVKFCPLCGCDQRPPRDRRPEVCANHIWFANSKFCSNCGAKSEAQATATISRMAAKDSPSPIFAWLLSLTWLLFAPLQKFLPVMAAIPFICIGVNILLLIGDEKELLPYEVNVSRLFKWIGILFTPVYLIARSLKLRDSVAPTVVSVIAFAQFLAFYFFGDSIWDRYDRVSVSSAPQTLFTTESFNQIRPGHSTSSVLILIGQPKRKTMTPFETWEYDSPSGNLVYEIRFRDGRVISKMRKQSVVR